MSAAAYAVCTSSQTRRSTVQERFLTAEACRALLARVERLCAGGGEVSLSVSSKWRGQLRWARNEIITGGETTTQEIQIVRRVKGMKQGAAFTSRLDDDGLLACVRRAEELSRFSQRDYNEEGMRTAETYATPNIWSDATFGMDMRARGAAYRKLVEPVVAANLLSAGYIEVTATGNGVLNSAGLFAYMPETRAEYSLTVRDPQGMASGWAGRVMRDWTKIDADALTVRAMDKCQRSRNAVAIEPGRYTVVLEPQAVADLMYPLVASLERVYPEFYDRGPWARFPDPSTIVGPDILVGGNVIGANQAPEASGKKIRTKITDQVLDQRITISADPMDREAGYLPFDLHDTTPMRAVKWIDAGVLKELSYPRSYANQTLNKPDPLNNNFAFRMSGGTTTVDEMIASTERGLLVTRLTNVRGLDFSSPSLLQTGTTSDGLWLIEHGKITTAVKNFRFRESPLYAFNNLQALGMPVPVLMRQPTVVPPAKVQDFSMTSLADAV